MALASEVQDPVALPRLPGWIRTRPPSGELYQRVHETLSDLSLGTVCREARCPNLPECWSAGAATIMLLGTNCSRRCRFCAVSTHWEDGRVDDGEPARVAEGVRRWGLRYVVLTQVCRDDLPDGGASVLAESVRAIHRSSPGTLVELLIGDLGGSVDSLATVVSAGPDVLAHNLETVRELSGGVRDHRASYARSLELLRSARRIGPRRLVTKSSLMLGLGETVEQLARAFQDLVDASVDLLTLGQYLRPGPEHLPVVRYVTPEEFVDLGGRARATGFSGVEAGPLVRSSYRAEQLYRAAMGGREVRRG